MAAPREWKLVFTCPTCKQNSEVSAAKMEAVISCPHCQSNVVIDREGIHDAAKRSREVRRIARRERQLEPEDYHRVADDAVGHGRVWGGMCAVLLVIAAISLVSGLSGHHTPNEDGKLYSAAKMFQSAWLDDDLDTASTFVLTSDRVLLEKRSAPRRAALVAGFGPKFRGRITNVEVIEKVESKAAVCVAFEVGGREAGRPVEGRIVGRRSSGPILTV